MIYISQYQNAYLIFKKSTLSFELGMREIYIKKGNNYNVCIYRC